MLWQGKLFLSEQTLSTWFPAFVTGWCMVGCLRIIFHTFLYSSVLQTASVLQKTASPICKPAAELLEV